MGDELISKTDVSDCLLNEPGEPFVNPRHYMPEPATTDELRDPFFYSEHPVDVDNFCRKYLGMELQAYQK